MARLGIQSAEFRTRPRSAAFEFSFTAHRDPPGTDFSFTPSFEGRNVKEIYDVLNFELVLAGPGSLTVINRAIDLTLLSGRTGPQSVSDYVRVAEQMFKKLVAIQRKTKVRLNLLRDLTETDVHLMEIVHAVVTAGFYAGGEFSFPTTNLNQDIELPMGKPVDLRFEGRDSVIFQILDTDIDMGSAEIIATNCTLSSETTDTGEHHVIVKPDPGTITVNFPEWQRKLSGEK